VLTIRGLRSTPLLMIDAIDMVLNPGEIRRISPDNIAEMFTMPTHNIPLNYLVDQLR